MTTPAPGRWEAPDPRDYRHRDRCRVAQADSGPAGNAVRYRHRHRHRGGMVGERREVDTGTLDVLQAVRPAAPLGLVSNATTTFADDLSRIGLDDAFDFIVNSSAIGCAKPSACFYEHALRRSGSTRRDRLRIRRPPLRRREDLGASPARRRRDPRKQPHTRLTRPVLPGAAAMHPGPPGLAALLAAHLWPTCSFGVPCQPGAARLSARRRVPPRAAMSRCPPAHRDSRAGAVVRNRRAPRSPAAPTARPVRLAGSATPRTSRAWRCAGRC